MSKIIKAELWDKMQYLFRHYYDRMVHCVLYYDSPIDKKIFKQVLVWTIENVPVLHSSFHGNIVEPYWEEQDYKIEDVLEIHENCKDIEESINSLIYQCIPTENNVQMKVGIFDGQGKYAIAIIVNHMCFDGGDFKYFIKKLSENYNKLLVGDYKLTIKNGTRSYDAVYSKLTEEESEIAKGLYKNISAVKDEHKFPFSEPSDIDRTMINRRKIVADKVEKFRAIGKNMNVTVNDLLLTFYIRALYRIGNFDKHESLAIPCMVDLRRYIDNSEKTGLTNHTGFMICNVKERGETINDTLIEVLKTIRKSKDDPFMGLYSLPLLKLAYTIFPYAISETAIRIGYLNPLIGMSNIGVLDHKALKMGDCNVIDGWMTGGVKYKPYMQLAVTTLCGNLTMTIAIRGNSEDKKIAETFFDYIEEEMDEFIMTNNNRIS